MTSPDNALWEQCWRDKNTAFHQKAINPLLQRFWSSLALPVGSRIFVPLCGKSLDLGWLAAQGYRVLGVELSPIAVRAFFRESRMQAVRTPAGALTEWRSGAVSIFCGDIFALTAAQLGPIAAVYDRAALTALPEAVRAEYVAHLHQLIPETCPIFLLTAEDPEMGEEGYPATVADEVLSLYAHRFSVDLAHVSATQELDPEAPETGLQPVEHKFYRLLPRRDGAGCV